MYPLTPFPIPHTVPIWPQRQERILAVGAAMSRWSQQMARLHRHLHITTVTWPTPLVASNAPGVAILPPPPTTFDLVHAQFLNLLLPQAQWPSVLDELVTRTTPEGWIEIVDAGIIATFPPTTALAAIEAMTALYADALHVDSFMPERLTSLLAHIPGVVTSTLMTTSNVSALGNGPDPRGPEIAALWLEQRSALFPLFARFGLLPGGERRSAALAREAQSECRRLKQPVLWRMTTTRAQIAPAWRNDALMERIW